MKMTIGQRIKNRRIELNLSVDEVAEKLNKNSNNSHPMQRVATAVTNKINGRYATSTFIRNIAAT